MPLSPPSEDVSGVGCILRDATSGATSKVRINADDFGMSHGVSRAIISLIRSGAVNTASLMVTTAAAGDAAARARSAGLTERIGLHLTLTWGRACAEAGRPFRDANFLHAGGSYADEAVVLREFRCQLERFRRLLGRDPAHVDSHQHVTFWHRPAAFAMARLREELPAGMPVRQESGWSSLSAALEQGKASALVERILEEERAGILALDEIGSELVCHPGFRDRANDVWNAVREREIPFLRRVARMRQRA